MVKVSDFLDIPFNRSINNLLIPTLHQHNFVLFLCAGEAEITCTSHGWDTAYSGKCRPGPKGPKGELWVCTYHSKGVLKGTVNVVAGDCAMSMSADWSVVVPMCPAWLGRHNLGTSQDQRTAQQAFKWFLYCTRQLHSHAHDAFTAAIYRRLEPRAPYCIKLWCRLLSATEKHTLAGGVKFATI